MPRPIGGMLLRGVGGNRYLAFYHEAKGKWTRCGHVWYDQLRWWAERVPGIPFRTRKEAAAAAGENRFSEGTEQEALETVSQGAEGRAPGPLLTGETTSPALEEPPFAPGTVVRGRGRLAAYRGFPVESCARFKGGRWRVFVLIDGGRSQVAGYPEQWELDVDG